MPKLSESQIRAVPLAAELHEGFIDECMDSTLNALKRLLVHAVGVAGNLARFAPVAGITRRERFPSGLRGETDWDG